MNGFKIINTTLLPNKRTFVFKNTSYRVFKCIFFVCLVPLYYFVIALVYLDARSWNKSLLAGQDSKNEVMVYIK
jgi:hypothetical protein